MVPPLHLNFNRKIIVTTALTVVGKAVDRQHGDIVRQLGRAHVLVYVAFDVLEDINGGTTGAADRGKESLSPISFACYGRCICHTIGVSK
mgnify:CR=1 FL=1